MDGTYRATRTVYVHGWFVRDGATVVLPTKVGGAHPYLERLDAPAAPVADKLTPGRKTARGPI